ncbi:transposase [Proteiniphilum sp. UBA1028]|jgi:hypothetical protein|uniref:transposase n=1 Tax=Proteiniphilum sp. UBA1028 TaxID=1947251 RepID=UPI000E856F28|nr:transposase [Proteiniphilum sp. UBA1028]HBG58864.1 hypothetical protein [Porphyromonadaceae bacterium]
MDVLPYEKHLSSWVGVSPGNNESTGKKSGRITYGNKRAKSILSQSVWAASRTKGTVLPRPVPSLGSPPRQEKGYCGVAHPILKSVYHVLKDEIPYYELGTDYLNSRVEARRKLKAIAPDINGKQDPKADFYWRTAR